MSQYTYEQGEPQLTLETYEWDEKDVLEELKQPVEVRKRRLKEQ